VIVRAVPRPRFALLALGCLLLCAAAGRPLAAAKAADAAKRAITTAKSAPQRDSSSRMPSEPRETPQIGAAVGEYWDRVARPHLSTLSPVTARLIAVLPLRLDVHSPAPGTPRRAALDCAGRANSYHRIGHWPQAPPDTAV